MSPSSTARIFVCVCFHLCDVGYKYITVCDRSLQQSRFHPNSSLYFSKQHQKPYYYKSNCNDPLKPFCRHILAQNTAE